MTGFGLDVTDREEILADFRHVRGEFDSDSQVAAVRETRERVAMLAEEVLSAL